MAGVKHRNTVITCFSTDDKRIVETTDMGAHKHGMDMHQREGGKAKDAVVTWQIR